MYLVINIRTTIQLSDELRRKLKILASKRDISYERLLGDMINIFSELDSSKALISIPRPLAEKIKKKIEGTGFNSVSEYVTYVIRQIESDKEESKEFSKKDEEKVKERLRKLGYL